MRQIVSFGGGGFSMEAGQPAARRVRARAHRQGAAEGLLPALGQRRRRPLHRPLLPPLLRRRAASPRTCRCSGASGRPAEPREHLLAQDLIYVGGGSVTSLIGVWRAHGIDEILRECWERGVVLCGLSAGSLCWFAEGVSTFHGPAQRTEGLGFLPWSNTVHYSSEPRRREALFEWLREGMAPGLRGRRRRRASFRRRGRRPGGRLAPATRAPTGSSCATATWSRPSSRPATSATPTRAADPARPALVEA